MADNDDKPDLRVVNGGRKSSTAIPPEMQQYMNMVAEQCAQFLASCYPEVAATDSKRIIASARAAARDIHALQPMMEIFTPAGRERFSKLRFGIERPSPIVGAAPTQPIGFEPPADIGKCTSMDDALKCATTCAFLLSDAGRALLYFHGYRLRFGLYENAAKPDLPPSSA